MGSSAAGDQFVCGDVSAAGPTVLRPTISEPVGTAGHHRLQHLAGEEPQSQEGQGEKQL